MDSAGERVDRGTKARRLNRSKSREDLEKEKTRQAEAEVVRLLESCDVRSLAELARRQGIPEKFRKKVWPILLEHHPLVTAKHIEVYAEQPHDGIPYDKIRREIKRNRQSLRHETGTRGTSPPSATSPIDKAGSLENGSTLDAESLDQLAVETAVYDAITKFLEENKAIEYDSGMSYVCLTLADFLYEPPSVAGAEMGQAQMLATCFTQMMYVMLWAPEATGPVDPSDSVVIKRIASFAGALKKLCPEVSKILHEEGVLTVGEEWLHTWIKWWCARDLRRAEKGRLWDWYLGFDQAFISSENKPTIDDSLVMAPEYLPPCHWHIFVCIALLESCKDAMDELEQSELYNLLAKMPSNNMDLIIKEAKCLHEKLVDFNTEEEEVYSRCSTES